MSVAENRCFLLKLFLLFVAKLEKNFMKVLFYLQTIISKKVTRSLLQNSIPFLDVPLPFNIVIVQANPIDFYHVCISLQELYLWIFTRARWKLWRMRGTL